MKKQIVVLVGPSGSGKTSIGQALSEKGHKKLVTTTTRLPRMGEVDGVDYYFRDKGQVDPTDFIEQTTYNGNIYGLTKSEIQNSLKNYDLVHVSLDQSGAKVLKDLYQDQAIIVYISVSIGEMLERLKKRGDSTKKIQERISFCQQTGELTPPEFADIIIKNKNFSETLQYLQKELNM